MTRAHGPLLLFAHGAGASKSSGWMIAWAERLRTIGRVVPFDYPYMAEGRRAPDRLPKLLDAHRNALDTARRRHRGPVFLIGKSMGSRVGCHLAVEGAKVDGVICLGYPLCAAGKKDKVRDEVLTKLQVPLQIVQGTRDPLFPLDVFARVRDRITTAMTLHIVLGGDHSLQTPKKLQSVSGVSQETSDHIAVEAIRAFVERASVGH